MEDSNVQFKIRPKFNFIYELFMPTGRKIKNTIVALLMSVVCFLFINIALDGSKFDNIQVINGNNVNIANVLNNIFVIIIIIIFIKLICHLIIQIWQYNSIQYTFYNEYLEYEDTFLNQHRKTLRYDNIKEIEIRRTIWDRINGYGIIIIYSNAEKSYNNGLILYSIKNPDETYAKLDGIIHSKHTEVKEDKSNKEGSNFTNEIIENEKEFKDSLKNKE